MAWIDQHCHLPAGAEGRQLAEEARAAGVERLITVGTGIEGSREMIALAGEIEGVWATAGVHPHDAKDGIDGLEELLSSPGVVAVGECGLDFHYDHSPRRTQVDMFARQIGLAHRHDLPLMIHSRSAWPETFEVLDREGVPERLVFHCFSGGTAELEQCLARGALVSFSGIITFARADELRAAVAACPLDCLLVETDSPYLAPVPHRGKPNRPALVPLVGAAVATVKGVPVHEVEAAVWKTSSVMYGLGEA
ncbi:MAG: TatD family hydrolase [Acidimicrobiaceae bacterium]|nr:TatD family hydrolase [Acidimicrobiia bacterium]MCY4494989.1 TatD family hydrolase [Acidimicrobiaceae bacterium]